MAFKTFDRDGSGNINLNEIKMIFDLTNSNANDDIFQKMIQEADSNDDGEISLDEFINLMHKFFN